MGGGPISLYPLTYQMGNSTFRTKVLWYVKGLVYTHTLNRGEGGETEGGGTRERGGEGEREFILLPLSFLVSLQRSATDLCSDLR